MRCETTHLQIISPADTDIRVQTYYVSVPKGMSVLSVQPGWKVDLPAGVKANNIPANAFFFSRSNNDREFQLLKEKLDLITSNISENQSVISSQLSALAADVAEIKATGAKSSEVSAIISRLDNLSGNGDSVTLSQFNELSGQVDALSGKIIDLENDMPKTENIIFNQEQLLSKTYTDIDGQIYPVYSKWFRHGVLKKGDYWLEMGVTHTILHGRTFINTYFKPSNSDKYQQSLGKELPYYVLNKGYYTEAYYMNSTIRIDTNMPADILANYQSVVSYIEYVKAPVGYNG